MTAAEFPKTSCSPTISVRLDIISTVSKVYIINDSRNYLDSSSNADTPSFFFVFFIKLQWVLLKVVRDCPQHEI
jgi:hypothetical protein